MQTPLLLAQMILAIALMAAILLQQRGTGLGGAFGGEVTAYRSRRGIERTLFRLTIVLALLFALEDWEEEAWLAMSRAESAEPPIDAATVREVEEAIGSGPEAQRELLIEELRP